MQAEAFSFFQIHLGEALVIGGLALAWLQYRVDRRRELAERTEAKEKERKEKEEAERTQLRMHMENKSRLDSLAEFQKNQIILNHQRDRQFEETHRQTASLDKQTAALVEIAKATNRRLEMLEDRGHD